MRGHTRRRGQPGSWEYIVDVGPAAAQRCERCTKRFWIERRPLKECPKCGGPLREAEERRRETKAGFRTQKDCQTAMNKILSAIDEHRYIAPSRITFRDYLRSEWLPAIEATIRPTTFASYKMLVEQHIIPELGLIPIQKLSAARINAFYAKLLKEGRCRGKGGLAPASVCRIHACIHRSLRDAVRWERLSVSPAAAVDPPRSKQSQRDLPAWNKEQLASFLAFIAADRLSCLWRFLAMTGTRRGEALGLRWEDVDIEQATVIIRRALVPVAGTVRISEPKTVRGRRTIALDPQTVEALKAHAARQADEQSQWGEAWTNSGYVFVREDGQPLHPERISALFRRLVKAACLPEIPLHGLRHTHATLALSAGVNPRIVSGRLGHSTVALTLDVYSHVLPQADAEAACKIASLI